MLHNRKRIISLVAATCVVVMAGLAGVVTSSVAHAGPGQSLDLKVLLIGQNGGDPTTAAWQSELTSEGVAYTLVVAQGSPGSETVTLPTLTDPDNSNHGFYNGVVVVPSVYDFSSFDALLPVWQYESTFNVRQIDAYIYPESALNGLNPVGSGDQSGDHGDPDRGRPGRLPGARRPGAARRQHLRLPVDQVQRRAGTGSPRCSRTPAATSSSPSTSTPIPTTPPASRG